MNVCKNNLKFQKWQDIIKEIQFLKSVQHENCVAYKGCYLKDNTVWVGIVNFLNFEFRVYLFIYLNNII